MEDRENSGGSFGGRFNKLISEHEFSADENTPDSNQETQQVSMSMVRPESSLKHYKLLAVSLAVLAVILLAVDISLGVSYYKLTDGLYLVTDINSELAKLHASYNTAIQRRDEAKKELANTIKEQQLREWEREHLASTRKSYEKEADNIQLEIATLNSHLPMIREGCRHCSAGWTFMNSACYYFPFSNVLVSRSWQEARDFCKKQGGDLAVIDSQEKQLALSELINKYSALAGYMALSGFWIGLRDVDEEGTWKWLDGRRLTVSFWITGEPNNQGNEDCAATYPRSNPFFAWNDAPCNHHLKWICEMAPRFAS
ncbi:CD209 antigen isoform X1 [Labrus bergylta]|uniref:CD209 antigen-like n=1 Tax=Labrus bergylta TaxID=56723 RepID=A0A3Q3KVF6_9LABR|nr:CD209 antigen-like [Labrus bergylta]